MGVHKEILRDFLGIYFNYREVVDKLLKNVRGLEEAQPNPHKWLIKNLPRFFSGKGLGIQKKKAKKKARKKAKKKVKKILDFCKEWKVTDSKLMWDLINADILAVKRRRLLQRLAAAELSFA